MRVYIDVTPEVHAKLKLRAAADERPISVWLRREVERMVMEPAEDPAAAPTTQLSNQLPADYDPLGKDFKPGESAFAKAATLAALRKQANDPGMIAKAQAAQVEEEVEEFDELDPQNYADLKVPDEVLARHRKKELPE